MVNFYIFVLTCISFLNCAMSYLLPINCNDLCWTVRRYRVLKYTNHTADVTHTTNKLTLPWFNIGWKLLWSYICSRVCDWVLLQGHGKRLSALPVASHNVVFAPCHSPPFITARFSPFLMSSANIRRYHSIWRPGDDREVWPKHLEYRCDVTTAQIMHRRIKGILSRR